MSYAKSVFFIPVWFDQFTPFTKAMKESPLWTPTDSKKVWARYLYHYAANLNKNQKLFASFTLKDPSALNIYMFRKELAIDRAPTIDEVRFSCFSTDVGFMEFWVSYSDMTLEDVCNFSYEFKKAKHNKAKGSDQQTLYDAAKGLIPAGCNTTLFFSTSAWFKYECNCFHFLHLDQDLPDEETRKATLFRLSRSYRCDMPVSNESAYDMLYEAGIGDYWSGCSAGLANVVYDFRSEPGDKSDYYLHNLKPQSLETDYYFMYLLLLNQKYSAIEYIRKVSESLDSNTKAVEALNRRIVMLKNTFSFNVVSDDSIVQNIYSKMYSVLEIRNLLEDVIENEAQMELLQKAKHMQDDRLSNKYLLGISLLSLFSALIDAAAFFDRVGGTQPVATILSIACVVGVIILSVTMAIQNGRK